MSSDSSKIKSLLPAFFHALLEQNAEEDAEKAAAELTAEAKGERAEKEVAEYQAKNRRKSANHTPSFNASNEESDDEEENPCMASDKKRHMVAPFAALQTGGNAVLAPTLSLRQQERVRGIQWMCEIDEVVYIPCRNRLTDLLIQKGFDVATYSRQTFTARTSQDDMDKRMLCANIGLYDSKPKDNDDQTRALAAEMLADDSLARYRKQE